MPVNVDNKTPRLHMPLPDKDNFLQDDVGRLITTIEDLDTQVALVAADGKLEPTQLPDIAAKVDAKGILLESQLPAKVVVVDKNGTIPMARIPAGALTAFREVSNATAMTALVATAGDVVKRLDDGNYYMLAASPATELANWRELPPTAVHSINGKTGAVTGIAEVDANGVNRDIKTLQGLTAPFVLPADGQNGYEAVTYRQLQQITAGQGATMNGVMNNFIGAVEWFNGDRLHIPAGYVAADGQEVKRTDAATADLWLAVDKGMYVSVTEALWQNSGFATNPYANRASYSTGDGSTTFRVPDLNGVQPNSIAALFLRGGGGGTDAQVKSYGSTGSVYPNGAPNITGSINQSLLTYRANTGTNVGVGAFVDADVKAVTGSGGAGAAGAARPNYIEFMFDASASHKAYGRIGPDGASPTGEVKPNAATGIWIIRASGAFSAVNTQFLSIAADAADPATNTTVIGGKLTSRYISKAINRTAASLYSSYTWGANTVYACIESANEYASRVGKFYFGDDGSFVMPANGTIATTPLNGVINVQASLLGNAHVQAKAGNKVGLVAAEKNEIYMTNYGSAVPAGTWANRLQGQWYDESWTVGGVRANNNQLAYVAMRFQTDTVYKDTNGNDAYKYYEISIRHNGELMGPGGVIQAGGSDIALKDRVGRAKPGAIDRINQFKTHEFTWKTTGRRDRGFIAQEIEHIDPLYTFQVDDILNVSDRAILADLIDSVKELTSRNTELESRLAALEAS